jgi:hypothetical protein
VPVAGACATASAALSDNRWRAAATSGVSHRSAATAPWPVGRLRRRGRHVESIPDCQFAVCGDGLPFSAFPLEFNGCGVQGRRHETACHRRPRRRRAARMRMRQPRTGGRVPERRDPAPAARPEHRGWGGKDGDVVGVQLVYGVDTRLEGHGTRQDLRRHRPLFADGPLRIEHALAARLDCRERRRGSPSVGCEHSADQVPVGADPRV